MVATAHNNQHTLVVCVWDRFGTDDEYQRHFFQAYAQVLVHTPVWPAFGNHDWRSSQTGKRSKGGHSILCAQLAAPSANLVLSQLMPMHRR